jgi:aryl-alcohol dehydrogenase-like predicted oxidoreductase
MSSPLHVVAELAKGGVTVLNRRDFVKNAALAGAASVLPSDLLWAFEGSTLITRAIPKTGERVPIVGLGTSATFREVAGADDRSALRGVIETLVQNGGTVLDTAPAYGASEEVCGEIAREIGATDKIFWATKVNVASRETGAADASQAREQIERSLQRLGKKPVDLIQVHNLADLATQVPVVQAYKEAGKIRYIGTTSTQSSRYGDLEDAMRNHPLDFIGVDYAVDNRLAAERILPLARDLGIAVLVYMPFGRSRLWARVEGKPVPEWAAEFGADSWGRFFLKYVAAHPAVTCITPATSKPKHMLDNMGAAYGELPDSAARRKMEEAVEALPLA